mgnify:CR=1 FL=1
MRGLLAHTRSRARAGLGCVAVAVALGTASIAAAEPAGKSKARPAKRGKDDPASRAEALRAQGSAALAKKDWGAVSDALVESYRLSPDGRTLYLLGQVAWNTGKTVAAQDLMRRFLADQASSEDAAARAEADKIVDQPRPASGEVLVASATEHPDLFWAIRGGGGNFGVATAFEFQAHPVSIVTAGVLFFELDKAAELMKIYRTFIDTAPRELGIFPGFLMTPPAPFLPAVRSWLTLRSAR